MSQSCSVRWWDCTTYHVISRIGAHLLGTSHTDRHDREKHLAAEQRHSETSERQNGRGRNMKTKNERQNTTRST